MANQIKWDKPTITVNDLNNILHMQYGPECTTRILMEDTNRQIPYKTALINCECLRCGKTFTMNPYGIVNSLYVNGYVCTTCGSLTDDEVKAQKKEQMRLKTIETLKDHGIDVIEEEFGDKKNKHPENPQDDEFSSSADEENLVEDDMYDLEETTDEAEISEESTTPDKETSEEKNESVNDYMVSDDDYSGTIGDSVEEGDEDVVEEEEIPEDTGDDESDDYISDIDSSNEEETSIEDEISEEDVFGVEEPKSELVNEESEQCVDNSEESVEEDDGDVVVDKEELPPQENLQNPEMIWVNDNPYTEKEIGEAFRSAAIKLQENLKFIPFDLDTCEVQDNKIQIVCKDCGQKVQFDSFEDLSTVEPLDEVLSRYGKSVPKGKINNYKKIMPLVTKCPICLNSVLNNGYNEYHKNEVIKFCKEANIEILEADKHLWINDNNEALLIKVNNIKKAMRWGEILWKYTDRETGLIKDARLDPLFKIAEPKPIEQTRSTESINVEAKVDENVNPINNSTKQNVFSIKEETVKNEQKEERIVIHPKNYDDFKKETEPKQETVNKSTSKKSVFTFNDSGKGSIFTSDRSTDSMENLETDRLKQERDINKKNVFSIGQKFKTGRKDIARLSGKINPFEREVSLKQEFEETVFFEFIEQLSQKTGVDYKLILNESSYEIPVIDFESGFRLICANLKESDLVNVRYEWINPRVPFSFFEAYAEDDGSGVLKKKRKKHKWCVLFSDSVEYARDATFAALVKYINPKILAYEGKKVVLQDNLIFQYTKHNQYLRDFDKRNSTFPSRKPNTGSIGIIARWNSSQQATAKDVLKFKLQMESANGNVANLDTLANNYNEYMVASIKYIEQFNKETQRVIYTITEYVEVGSSIIADGFAQCLRALLKEYIMRYPQLTGIDPFVVVEVDPSTFPSPSLYSYVERGTLCKVDSAFKSQMTGQMNANQGVDRNLKYSYVRRPEYRRNNDIDNMRQDRRMFTTGSLIARMSEEIKQAGLSNTIRNPETKKQFIGNMGYVEATQPETALYFVNRSVLATLMVDGYTMSLQEHIDENNFNATKMVNDSTMGIGVNNVMMNPNLMMKYNNIMNGGSAEAKDLFNRMVQEDYQQKMMDMMMNSQGQQAQASVNPNQMPFNPMMGMGMNPMMSMMGGMNMTPPMPGMGF